MKLSEAILKSAQFKTKKVKILKKITLSNGEIIKKGTEGDIMFQHDDGSYHFESNEICSACRVESAEFKVLNNKNK